MTQVDVSGTVRDPCWDFEGGDDACMICRPKTGRRAVTSAVPYQMNLVDADGSLQQLQVDPLAESRWEVQQVLILATSIPRVLAVRGAPGVNEPGVNRRLIGCVSRVQRGRRRPR